MKYAEICREVDRVKKKYNESDPYALCRALGIIVITRSLGNTNNAIKGFFFEINRIKTITLNADLPPAIQKIIVTHELGHALLHRRSGGHAFHDVGLFDESTAFEKDANLFAAEFLLDDEDVLAMLNADHTFFSAAAALYVPIELLDFKFRIMKWKGYKLVEPPISARSKFLKAMEVPKHGNDYGC